MAEWMTSLHNEQVPELWDINLFMDHLKARFEDESQALQAEIEIHSLRQRTWEFLGISGNSEKLVVESDSGQNDRSSTALKRGWTVTYFRCEPTKGFLTNSMNGTIWP